MNELYEDNDKSLMDVVCELPEYDEKQFDSQYLIASNTINEWVENEYNKWEKDILTIIPKDKIGLYLLGKLTYILEEFKDYNPYTIEEWNECSSKDSEDCFFCLALKRYVGAINDILYNYDIDEDENIKKIYEYAWFIYAIDEDEYEDDEDDDEIPLNTIPENKLDFSNFSQSKNDELQKYSIQEIKQYALANNIEIIEHARPNSISIGLLYHKLPNIPLAECYNVIEKCFEEIANEKHWTLGGKISIYIQDKKVLYKSFVYDIIKELKSKILSENQNEKMAMYEDLIHKFNSFYEEWEKNHQQIDIKKEKQQQPKTKNKYTFKEEHINILYSYYNKYHELEDICTKHEFVAMFENANFSKALKNNGEVPVVICKVIYSFKKEVIAKESYKKEWYESACKSIGRDNKQVYNSQYDFRKLI